MAITEQESIRLRRVLISTTTEAILRLEAVEKEIDPVIYFRIKSLVSKTHVACLDLQDTLISLDPIKREHRRLENDKNSNK
jgi:hypothetical protein